MGGGGDDGDAVVGVHVVVIFGGPVNLRSSCYCFVVLFVVVLKLLSSYFFLSPQ